MLLVQHIPEKYQRDACNKHNIFDYHRSWRH